MSSDSSTALPESWELREAKDYPGRCYYYNRMTKESTWIHPSRDSSKISRPQHFRMILIKHRHSTNPYGRDNARIERTRDEARAKIKQIRSVLSDHPESFGEIANKESDMKDSVSNGVLGWLRKDEIPPDLQQAWSLKVGAISGVLESSMGFHIFARDA